MKKITLVLVVLLAAVPAMAVVNINAVQVGDTSEVDIIVTWSGEGTPPRAFALDITVDAGTITDVLNYHTGESRGPGDRGFGIFPASFNREIDADDPNWADANYTPEADPCDLPGGTQGGIGTSGVTIEMGSLYTGPNVPPSPSMLCTIIVTDDCNVCFALNVGRAGIVMEDGNPPSSDNMPCTKVTLAAVECLKDTDPYYAKWADYGKPDCWCYRKQCRGDADGKKTLLKPVMTPDLTIFKAAFNKSKSVVKTVVINGVPGICADFDHKDTLLKPVMTPDLTIFKAAFNKADGLVPECDATHINFWTN